MPATGHTHCLCRRLHDTIPVPSALICPSQRRREPQRRVSEHQQRALLAKPALFAEEMGNFHQHDQRVAPGALLETNRERTLCLARRASRDRVVASTSCSLPLPSLYSPPPRPPHFSHMSYATAILDLRGFQHRYFHLNGVSLSYIELMGRHELHGTAASDNVSTCSAPSTMWARPAREKTWVHSRWAQGLAKLALALAPTVLVVNIGHVKAPSSAITGACPMSARARRTSGARRHKAQAPRGAVTRGKACWSLLCLA